MRRWQTRKPTFVGIALAIATACSSPPAAAPGSTGASPDAGTDVRASLDDTLHVQVGRSASVDGGRLVLTFVSRGPDSRCPANVVCVWMGDAAVRVAARTGSASIERELHTGLEPHSLAVNGYVVTVVGLLPYPGTGITGTPTVLLRITRG